MSSFSEEDSKAGTRTVMPSPRRNTGSQRPGHQAQTHALCPALGSGRRCTFRPPRELRDPCSGSTDRPSNQSRPGSRCCPSTRHSCQPHCHVTVTPGSLALPDHPAFSPVASFLRPEKRSPSVRQELTTREET